MKRDGNRVKYYAKRILALFLAGVICFWGIGGVASAYGEVPLSVSEEYSLSMDIAKTKEYTAWKEENWTDENSSNSGRIVLTPGSDAGQMNFSWYSETSSAGFVSISMNPMMSGAVVYPATVEKISRKNWKKTYKQ